MEHVGLCSWASFMSLAALFNGPGFETVPTPSKTAALSVVLLWVIRIMFLAMQSKHTSFRTYKRSTTVWFAGRELLKSFNLTVLDHLSFTVNAIWQFRHDKA